MFGFEGAGSASEESWPGGQVVKTGASHAPIGSSTLPRVTKILYIAYLTTVIYIVGVFIDEGPPVPIPNTEVKLIYAEDTCLETDRENRSMPTQMSLMYVYILGSHIPP